MQKKWGDSLHEFDYLDILHYLATSQSNCSPIISYIFLIGINLLLRGWRVRTQQVTPMLIPTISPANDSLRSMSNENILSCTSEVLLRKGLWVEEKGWHTCFSVVWRADCAIMTQPRISCTLVIGDPPQYGVLYEWCRSKDPTFEVDQHGK